MPKHTVIGGAAAYQDADGHERWAYNGDVIDFTPSEATRLMGMGMLFDQDAADQRAAAEAAALEAAREWEDQRLADEAERQAGELAAATAQADTQADKVAGDKVPKGPTVADLEAAADASGVDRSAATTRQEIWNVLGPDARAAVLA